VSVERWGGGGREVKWAKIKGERRNFVGLRKPKKKLRGGNEGGTRKSGKVSEAKTKMGKKET